MNSTFQTHVKVYDESAYVIICLYNGLWSTEFSRYHSFLLKFYLVVPIFTSYYEKIFFSFLLEIGNAKGTELDMQKNKKKYHLKIKKKHRNIIEANKNKIKSV